LPGYKITIGMYYSGLMLWAKISTKIMRRDTVLDFYRECMRSESGLVSWFIFYIVCLCLCYRYFIFLQLFA